MQKILLGTLVIVFALTLSACGNKVQNQEQEKNQVQEQKTENSGGVISSIKEAMGLGKKMECTYTNKIGDQEVTAITWVDGKNFKSSSEIDGRKMYSVMKDETMYTWGEGVPVASMLKLSCMQELEKDLPKTEGQEAKSSVKDPGEAFEDATNVSCKPVASVDISVPSDVQFTDQCEMIKGLTNKLKDMKVPGDAGNGAGINMPNIPDMPNIPGR